jgi:hypothetical protein
VIQLVCPPGIDLTPPKPKAIELPPAAQATIAASLVRLPVGAEALQKPTRVLRALPEDENIEP